MKTNEETKKEFKEKFLNVRSPDMLEEMISFFLSLREADFREIEKLYDADSCECDNCKTFRKFIRQFNK